MDRELFKDTEHYSENIIRCIKGEKNHSSVTEVYPKEVKRSEYWKDVGALFTNNESRMLEELKKTGQKMDSAKEASLLFISLLKKKVFIANRREITYTTSVIFAWRTALYWFFHRILKEDNENIPDDYFKFLEDNDYLGDYLKFTERYESEILQNARECFNSFQNNRLASNDDYKQALEFVPKFSQFEKDLFAFFSTGVLKVK